MNGRREGRIGVAAVVLTATPFDRHPCLSAAHDRRDPGIVLLTALTFRSHRTGNRSIATARGPCSTPSNRAVARCLSGNDGACGSPLDPVVCAHPRPSCSTSSKTCVAGERAADQSADPAVPRRVTAGPRHIWSADPTTRATPVSIAAGTSRRVRARGASWHRQADGLATGDQAIAYVGAAVAS